MTRRPPSRNGIASITGLAAFHARQAGEIEVKTSREMIPDSAVFDRMDLGHRDPPREHFDIDYTDALRGDPEFYISPPPFSLNPVDWLGWTLIVLLLVASLVGLWVLS